MLPDSPTPVVPAAEEPAAGADPLPRSFLRVRTLVSFALAIGLLAVVVGRLGVEVGDIAARLGRIDVRFYLAALTCQFLVYPVRALRWCELLRNVDFATAPGRRLPTIAALIRVVLLARFAQCVVPAKLDLPYAAYLLRRSVGIPFSATVGVMLAERLVELFTLLTLLTISGSLALGAAPVAALLPIREAAALLFGLLALGLLGLRVLRRPIDRIMPGRLRPHYLQFRSNAFGALRPGRLPPILACSLLASGLSATRLYLVCQALGLAGLGGPLVVFASSAIGLLGAPSLTPGGLGVTEAGLVAILLLAGRAGLVPGLDADLAVSVAILDRSISYWSVVAVGLVVYTLSTYLPNRRTAQ